MNLNISEHEWNQIVEAAFAPDAPDPQFSPRYCAKRQALERRIAMKQHNRTMKKHSAGFFIAAAAACAALSGVTAAATTGKLDLFRNILSQTKPGSGPESPAALVDPAPEDTALHNLAETETVFTGEDSLRVSTVAMNYDSNSLILMLAIETQNGTVLPQDALFVPYFERVTADGVQQMNSSGISAVEHLVTDTVTDTAYLTYYLTQPEIAGSTLRVTLKNAYSQAQLNTVRKDVYAAQEQWRNDYGWDALETAEWKALWQAEDLDGRALETEAALLAESDSVLTGTWTADLAVPELDSVPMTVEKDGFRVTADTLSLYTEYDKETTASLAYLVKFKDGTVLCDYTDTNGNAYLKECGEIDDNTAVFAYGFGAESSSVRCYDAPHAAEDIAEISVYLFDYEPDADGHKALTAEKHILYTAS